MVKGNGNTFGGRFRNWSVEEGRYKSKWVGGVFTSRTGDLRKMYPIVHGFVFQRSFRCLEIWQRFLKRSNAKLVWLVENVKRITKSQESCWFLCGSLLLNVFLVYVCNCIISVFFFARAFPAWFLHYLDFWRKSFFFWSVFLSKSFQKRK